ncbi:MAG: T9SS type A sorting domain-containing protein, partial [Bacteroidales bacterium]|nr:T9SS type A sorting domain-containing protein [Bacteroidales bacterium]
PNDYVGKVDFAIAPSDQNIIYANVITSIGYLYNIYKSTNQGKTWQIILPGNNSTYSIFDGQGLYSSTIAVYPNNPDKILVGCFNLWQGTKYDEGYYQWQEKSNFLFPRLYTYFIPSGHHTYVFRPGSPNQFLIGTDGGISISLNGDEEFMLKNKNYNTTQFYTVSCSVNKKEILGGTQDNGILYIKGEGSPDVSKRADQILTGNGGYTAMSIINPNVYIFAGSEGAVSRSETRGLDVSNTFLGSGMESIEFINPFILWECFNEQRSQDSVKFYAKLNNYNTFDTISIRSNNFEYPFSYILPHALNAGDSIMVKDIIQSKFFWAQDNEIYMTTEILDFTSAPTWFQISEISGIPQCIALSSDANFVYVGTQEGKVFRIANVAYAYSFDEADVSSPFCIISTSEIPIIHDDGTENTQAVTSVYVDPQDPNNVILTLGNYGNSEYIFLCQNAIDQYPEFTSIQGDPNNDGLPQIPVYSSIIEMKNSNLAIIGTEKGVYVSDNIFDSSPTWEKQSNNFYDTPVFMIKQQTTYTQGITVAHHDSIAGSTSYEIFPPVKNFGDIYCATYGKGVYIDDSYHIVGIDDDIFNNSKQTEISLYPNPVIDQITISFELTKSANTFINIYDLTGKLVKSIDLQHEPAGIVNCKINVNDLNNGTYILHLISGEKQTSAKFIVAN